MRARCPAHLIRLDLIYLMISDEEYKLRSSLLCNLNTELMNVKACGGSPKELKRRAREAQQKSCFDKNLASLAKNTDTVLRLSVSRSQCLLVSVLVITKLQSVLRPA
jgi:hypothetical protein